MLDIIAMLTNQNDYTKTRNYWKYLKAKLKKENSELVSVTTQLKLLASDGKRYITGRQLPLLTNPVLECTFGKPYG